MLTGEQLSLAKCADHIKNGGKDYWFPDTPSAARKFDYEKAVRICHSCPIEQECLKDALKQSPLPPHGVWGGLTPTELHSVGLKMEIFCPECGRRFRRLNARQIFCSQSCSSSATSRLAAVYDNDERKALMVDPFTLILFEDFPRMPQRGLKRMKRFGDERHGTASGYTTDRCRCDRCRDYKRSMDRRSRKGDSCQ